MSSFAGELRAHARVPLPDYVPPASGASEKTASFDFGRIRAWFTPRVIAITLAAMLGWLMAAFELPLP